MNYGYIKVASAIPSLKVGDVNYNLQQTQIAIAQAEGKGVEVIVFPELSLTGYTCQDLFRQQLLIDSAEQAVVMLLDFTRQLDIIAIVGVPVIAGNILLNCAAVIQKGDLLALIPKTFLPNYSEFYEKRWFASSHMLEVPSISQISLLSSALIQVLHLALNCVKTFGRQSHQALAFASVERILSLIFLLPTN